MFRFLLFATCVVLALGLPSKPRNKFIVPRLDGRIVGGKDADIKDFPYQVSLEFFGSHMCGASIINANHVVTAAHCTDGNYPEFLNIRAGSTRREEGGQVIQVEEIYQHPDFTMDNLNDDVSVLKLAGNIQFGEGAQPIDLTDREPVKGDVAVVTGWGTLSSGGSLPKILQQVNVNIIDRPTCKNDYGADLITNAMICAGAPGKDACQGDSGGPLVVNGKLAGIVSWGYGCADPHYPGIYSNVNLLRDYINKYS